MMKKVIPIILFTVSAILLAVCPECGHTEMYLEDLTKLK